MRGVSYNFQFLLTVLVGLLASLNTTTKYNDKDVFCYSEPEFSRCRCLSFLKFVLSSVHCQLQ